MANDLDNCSFSGRMGNDPEVRYTPSGTAVANFSLAVGKKYKGEDSTLWIKVVSFGKLAEIVGEYGSKGQQAIVNGPLQIQEWEDKDGSKRYSTEVIANFFQLIGGKGQRNLQDSDPWGENKPKQSLERQIDDDSTIPF